MNSNLGKPLSKSEMKAVQGGKFPGCAVQGQNGNAYSLGCCTGLAQCPGTTHTCEPPTDPCFDIF
ncbi:hypothetical protein KXD93_29105 [Mucilaginibacter sp. BJC16-A38]|uniref:hypothetical protein n=1 Tax=Mucilaginibacter phenanthrenivorans TaxID=1234842 RepID=UPI002157BE88|nr:hypothetical protein [Mucilaginibacter phenanthrenivorans]MCR8561750.1 hypothetical protein [Mucilaginibacter phenanthrenivorans]